MGEHVQSSFGQHLRAVALDRADPAVEGVCWPELPPWQCIEGRVEARFRASGFGQLAGAYAKKGIGWTKPRQAGDQGHDTHPAPWGLRPKKYQGDEHYSYGWLEKPHGHLGFDRIAVGRIATE